MTRADALRARLPRAVRPFTVGVWSFIWVGVAAIGALWFFGAEAYDRASAAREQARTQSRLLGSMRTLVASEGVEEARAATLNEWLEEGAPARVQATSVEIGVTRLHEGLERIAAGAGENVRVVRAPGSVPPQREALIEAFGDGRSLHLVRIPVTIESQTMAGMARVLEQIDASDTLWLRPGNAQLSKRIDRRGEVAVLSIVTAWALIEVRPEGR